MTQTTNDAAEWTRSILDRAVQELSDLGIMSDELIEVRSVWSIPENVMIGQARPASEPALFVWFISGNLPTDYIGSSVATTPRDALRHFSMKWQLDAERYRDPATRIAHGLDESIDWNAITSKMVAKAEELYAMAEDDSLWQQTTDA